MQVLLTLKCKQKIATLARPTHSHVDGFNTRNKVFTAKPLKQGLDIINFIRRFKNLSAAFSVSI